MPRTTQNFAVSPPPPARSGSVTSDALSDVLHAIHLRGGEVARVTSDGWSRHEHPSGARMVHIVEHGELRVELPAGEPTELDAGDLVLLARGDSHVVHAPATAGWVTGEFLVENAVADPLLSVLPPAIVIRGEDEDTAAWLPTGLALMVDEMTDPRPGSRVMISRILDLLFIRALRVWAASGQANPGWLTAAMDPALGRALSAIHQAPERNWSIDELARLAALSRSAFATRFSERLGQPPGAYLLHQRLGHAAHLLRSTTEPVGRVAAAIGYASEAAFSRAFTREYGHSPRAWRTAQARRSG